MRRLLASAAGLSLLFAAGIAVAGDAKQDKAPASTDKAPAADKQADAKKDKAPAKKTESKAREGGLLPVGAAAPAWSLPDADGKMHNLADYSGKVVVLDFWATWCGPCRKAMPDVQKIHDQFKDKGVVVIGVATWERGSEADQVSKPASYMKEQKFSYNLLVKGDAVSVDYGVSGIPTLYVIGPDGKVVLAETGFNHGTVVSAIQQALPKS